MLFVKALISFDAMSAVNRIPRLHKKVPFRAVTMIGALLGWELACGF